MVYTEAQGPQPGSQVKFHLHLAMASWGAVEVLFPGTLATLPYGAHTQGYAQAGGGSSGCSCPVTLQGKIWTLQSLLLLHGFMVVLSCPQPEKKGELLGSGKTDQSVILAFISSCSHSWVVTLGAGLGYNP